LAFDAALTGRKMQFEYIDKNREGDHICYVSNLSKLRLHFPCWNITKSLENIFAEILASASQLRA
jgi:CDP-paratose 2-epimerase